MAGPRKDRAFEKHAWLIPFVLGLFFFVSSIAVFVSPAIFTGAEGMFQTLTGHDFSYLSSSSPGVASYIYWLIRVFGFTGLGLGAFLAGVSATAYKRGERWAWYLMWIMPGTFVLDVGNDWASAGFVDVMTYIIIALFVTGLLLPYRKFFPKVATGSGSEPQPA